MPESASILRMAKSLSSYLSEQEFGHPMSKVRVLGLLRLADGANVTTMPT